MGKHRATKVRVIAGQYKGRRLTYPDTGAVRPTMDRTREALFSVIQDRVERCVFVDLFSAGGSVGIEALSRGAARAEFVEQLPEAVDHLRRNLDACGIAAGRYRIHITDVFTFLGRGDVETDEEIIVFADPPYDGQVAMRLLAHFGEVNYENVLLFVLEHRDPIDAPELGDLVFVKTKKFGDTSLSFWARRQ